MGERAVHDQSRLFAEIERWRLEAQETKMEAERRESELRLEAHEATQQARRLTSLVEDRTKYTVWVQTGSVKGSGTSAKPTICLIGTHDRSSGDLPLEATGPHRDGAFDRHVLTEFKIECGYVGDITDILIGHDLDRVRPRRGLSITSKFDATRINRHGGFQSVVGSTRAAKTARHIAKYPPHPLARRIGI